MAVASGERSDSYLVDTNLLLRSAQPNAPEHPLAVEVVAMLQEEGVTLYLTPQNIIEFWSVATRPREVNGLGMTPAQADAELRRLEGVFTLLPDIPEIYVEWRQLALTVGVSGRQVHDARLAAVMRAHRVTHILTFNVTDFARYPGITAVHPLTLATAPPDDETEPDAQP